MSQSHAVQGAGVGLALTQSPGGITLLPQATPLTRLNYFDGKFLRAADLAQEQAYLRELAALGNQGGGAGVVYGFSVALRGAALQLESGLAIDRDGHVLLLTEARPVDVAQLIEASRETPRAPHGTTGGRAAFEACTVELKPEGGGTGIPATELYLLTICRAEELCGQEDVLGALCEEACATTTGRPFRVEGVVLRAEPLRLPRFESSKSVAYGPEHLRSLVASAYYEQERRAEGAARLISGRGLRSDEWCDGAGHRGGCAVPLGVLATRGDGVVFLDAWTARRERMEAHPRRHWAFAMAMRPWDVFLAQVLQFQCQLQELLGRDHEPSGPETCAPHRQVLAATAAYLEVLEKQTARQPGVRSLGVTDLPGGATALAQLRERLHGALEQAVVPDARMLIRGGIVELPAAGYLPVRRGIPVNDQVRAWMGEGVELRFCTVRPDYVPHALEEAQHMERISLLQGLDDPARRPQVDVLVPNGQILDAEAGPAGRAYEGVVGFGATGTQGAFGYEGVGRTQRLPEGGTAFHFAGASRNTTGRLDGLYDVLSKLDTEGLEGSLDRVTKTASAVKSPAFHRVLGDIAENARRFTVANHAAFRDPEGTKPDVGEFLKQTEHVDAGWMTLQTDRALSRLTDADGRARLSGRAVLAAADKKITAVDLTVSGSFDLLQAHADLGHGRQVDGLLPLTFTVSLLTTTETTVTEVTSGIRLDLLATLVYEGDEHEGSVKTTLSNAKKPGVALIGFETSWTGAGRTLTVGVTSFKKAKQPPLAHAEFTANAGVLAENEEHHELAVDALDLVQAALLAEPAFESTAKGLLFAPLGENAIAPLVNAVEDWVVFHRRRTKHCQALPERPAVEPPRRYRVLELTAESLKKAKLLYDAVHSATDAEQDEARKALAANDKDPRLYVDFEGGSDDVSPAVAAAFAEDWPRFEPGRRLAYALIARPNASDQLVERRRLAGLKAAIPGGLTNTSSVVGEDVLVAVPPALADAAADGSVLFITIAPPAERHRVIGSDGRSFEAFAKRLGEAKTAEEVKTLFGLLGQLGLQPVDDTDFLGGTTTFVEGEDDELRTDWGKSPLDGAPLEFGAVWASAAASPLPADEMERRRKQTVAIEAAIFKTPAKELRDVTSGVAPSVLDPGIDGKPCDAVTFLIVERPIQVKVVLMIRERPAGPQPVITWTREGFSGDVAKLEDLAAAMPGGARVSVQLETDADRAAAATIERSRQLVELLGQAKIKPAKVMDPQTLTNRGRDLIKDLRGSAAEVFFVVVA